MTPVLPTWTPIIYPRSCKPPFMFLYPSKPSRRGAIIQTCTTRFINSCISTNSVQYKLDKAHTCNHDSFCCAEGCITSSIGNRAQESSEGKLTKTRPQSQSGLIQPTISLVNGRGAAAKTEACRRFTTGSSTEWHVPCVFSPKSSVHPLDVILTSPHVTLNPIARRALEGCRSCKQEPTNESDIFVIIIKLVFIIIDGLQGLQVELVSE